MLFTGKNIMEYVAPKTAIEASKALVQDGAFALAGGTDLLVKLKTKFVSPSVVVDIKQVPKITSIEESTDGWWIGAATPCAEIVEHESLHRDCYTISITTKSYMNVLFS